MTAGEARLTIMAAVTTVLASVSLYPLFTNGRWFWMSLGAIVVTLGITLAARALSAPHALVPPAALAGLLCFLTACFAGSEAFLGAIPGPEALGELGGIADRGFTDIQRYAAPVPAFTSITLVTTAGIGFVAVLVDLVAVRLRRAAVAGLPLLAIFSVTAAIQQEGAGWLPFVITASGFAALLLTDSRDRLGRWGRRVASGGQQSAMGGFSAIPSSLDTASLAAAGRRIGVLALAVAIVIPALLPELPSRAAMSGWLAGFGSGGPGASTIRAPNPLVSLKRELTLPADRVVLRYRTKDPSPGYLRLYSLDQFNGRTWSMSPLRGRDVRTLSDERLPPPRGLSRAKADKVNTRITIDRQVRGLRFLPMPYPPRQVDIRGEWRFERNTLMVYSTSDVAGGRTYEVKSWTLRPSRARLRSVSAPPPRITDRYLRLPDNLPALVTKLADRVTNDSDSAYDKARDLQDWFTEPGRFTYSLEVAPSGGSSALVSFLRERIGYCQQFASAMAIMARELGIPARVAVGYTAGSMEDDNTWVVTTHDAHAWPELYFQGVGWIRFEPTPAAGGQPTATTPDYAEEVTRTPIGTDGRDDTTPQDVTGGESPPAMNSDARERLERQLRLEGAPTQDPSAPTRPTFPVWPAVLGFALLLVAGTPGAARALVRWRRWARAGDATTRAHVAWQELCADAEDLGVGREASDSPRAFARRLSQGRDLDGPTHEALGRLTRAEERARYARTPADDDELRRDGRTVRHGLAATVGWSRKVRARLLPASMLVGPRRVVGWIADALDWLDSLATVGTRLRARVIDRTK